jgi:hypothetical protein
VEIAILKKEKRRKTKKSREYGQGVEAQRRFEKTMTALFQAPKIDSKKQKKGKG